MHGLLIIDQDINSLCIGLFQKVKIHPYGGAKLATSAQENIGQITS